MQCVGGYFIRAVNLPRFWYYWAHFIDFQVSSPLTSLYFESVTQRKTAITNSYLFADICI